MSSCGSPKKPAVQSTLQSFRLANDTADLENDAEVDVGKKVPPSSRPKKRRRSPPTLPDDSDDKFAEKALNNNAGSDSARRKSLRTKNEKMKPEQRSSVELDSDSDFESKDDLKRRKSKRKSGKTDKKVKKLDKVVSPKCTPEVDKKKSRRKFSTPPEKVRSILSYFAKSTTPSSTCAAVDVICVEDTVDIEVDVIPSGTPVKFRGRGRDYETTDPELLHISPAKSELSVSSFEFEKEERRPSIMISSDSDSEIEATFQCISPLVEVVSSSSKEDEESEEVLVIRSNRKRIKLNTPEVKPRSKQRGSVKLAKIKKNLKSSLDNTEHEVIGFGISKSESGSEPEVDCGRRRSSRIQKLQIEKMEQLSKVEDVLVTKPGRNKSLRRKKLRNSSTSSEDSVTIEEDEAVESASLSQSSSDEDDDFVRSKKKKTVKIASIFLSKKDREKELQRLKEEKEPKKIINQATLDFLRSGVPDQIVKAQKSIEKRKTESDLFEPFQLFPTFSHNVELADINPMNIDFTESKFPIKPSPDKIEQVDSLPKLPPGFPNSDKISCNDCSWKQLCCGESAELSPEFLSIMERIPRHNSEADSLPWVDKYRVERRKDLVIDKTAHQKFERWLKQWRSDIKDDGGVSRKTVEKKKKKRDSDSDFVTEEEAEEDYMKKSVVLVGPTGCGKTAMVYVLTKQIGFKIVEVSFSSRRSGKDVIQSVEEATLSRRITDNAEVDDDHCLLLFKDIDQLHPEEDEGFHAAVAQLITASCRPIVMTTSQTDFSVIDPKIHKKDPLWIYFKPPTPTAIVQNVLLPIIETELERQKRSYDLDSNEKEKRIVTCVLESLVRHSKCDIRRSLNQAQILWSSKNSFNLKYVHWNMCPLLDLEFIAAAPTYSSIYQEEDSKVLKKSKSKAERLLVLQEMDDLAKNLRFLSDIDFVSSALHPLEADSDHCPLPLSERIRPYFETGYQAALSEMQKKNEANFDTFRTLAFETDEHKSKFGKITELYDELSSYVDQYDNYDAISYVRTIVKGSVLRSVGSDMKRNGRIKAYFNRLGRDAIDRMCNNFDFQQDLANLKEAVGSEIRSEGRYKR